MRISELKMLLADAFARKMAANPDRFSPKRHPFLDDRTGPEAGADYLLKHVARNSSIRKRMRAGRIWRGLRPFKYDVPGKRERKVAQRSSA